MNPKPKFPGWRKMSQAQRHAARLGYSPDAITERTEQIRRDCEPAPIPGEREPLLDVVLRELCPHRICCLCGNGGIIDTRGVVFGPLGQDCGARAYCICPNGRALKAHGYDINTPEGDA